MMYLATSLLHLFLNNKLAQLWLVSRDGDGGAVYLELNLAAPPPVTYDKWG